LAVLYSIISVELAHFPSISVWPVVHAQALLVHVLPPVHVAAHWEVLVFQFGQFSGHAQALLVHVLPPAHLATHREVVVFQFGKSLGHRQKAAPCEPAEEVLLPGHGWHEPAAADVGLTRLADRNTANIRKDFMAVPFQFIPCILKRSGSCQGI
jgi:hypothetical protein